MSQTKGVCEVLTVASSNNKDLSRWYAFLLGNHCIDLSIAFAKLLIFFMKNICQQSIRNPASILCWEANLIYFLRKKLDDS